MNNWIIVWSEISLIDWGLNIILKSTILLLLALSLVKLLAHSAAKFRYSVWKGTFLLFFLLPFIGLLPSINITPANQMDESLQTLAELPIPYQSLLENTAERNSKKVDPQLNQKESYVLRRFHYSDAICLLWVIGCSYFLIVILVEYFFLFKITKESRRAIPTAWGKTLKSAEQQMTVPVNTKIILSKQLNTPVTFCLWRTNYILMPMTALDWKAEQIKTVFLHELGHFRQKDLWMNLLVQLVKALYWWHPLIWITIPKVRLECERSCDELVLESGESNLAYAHNLTEIAKIIFLTPSQLSKVTLPLVNNSQLKDRISNILELDNPFLTTASWRRWRVSLCLMIPLLCLNFNYAPNVFSEKNETTLIRQLTSANDAKKIEAAKALGELRLTAAYAPLVATLNSENSAVRAIAAWALGQIQKKEAIADLLPLINDQADCVKEWALLSLGEYGSSKSFYAVLGTQGHSNPEIRKATLWSLHQIGCLPSFHHISQHLHDENEEVRLLANRLLRDFPKDKLRQWLIKNRYTSQQEWMYGHYLGIKNLGKINLLVHQLAENKQEKETLEMVIQQYHSIEVLEKVFSIIDE